MHMQALRKNKKTKKTKQKKKKQQKKKTEQKTKQNKTKSDLFLTMGPLQEKKNLEKKEAYFRKFLKLIFFNEMIYYIKSDGRCNIGVAYTLV